MSKITQNGEQLEIIIPSMHQDISSVLRIGSTFVQSGQQVTLSFAEGIFLHSSEAIEAQRCCDTTPVVLSILVPT
ncbi:MAG TPA: hypothetical protein VKQ08_06290 [Cyclobacteriaceae bacterium]|nr:hypothetical protein [Cyclobacteriaceae bacterium]